MNHSLFIGRFQPFHKGHLSVIEQIFTNSEKPLIVIGSAQESNTDRNPLTAEEREILIKETLTEKGLSVEKDYEIGKLNDIGDLANWSNFIHKVLPSFDKVYTGSQMVKDCLLGKYSDKDSFPKNIPKIINLERKLWIKATIIREKILKKIFYSKVAELTFSFLMFLNKKDRLGEFKNIAECFGRLYLVSAGVLKARLPARLPCRMPRSK